jgi:GT2 family glycosyltransferase
VPEDSLKTPGWLDPAVKTAENELEGTAKQDETALAGRVSVCGKFLFRGASKFWVKGVTYGTFAPGESGHQFPSEPIVKQDFAAITQAGFNTVRVYTPPPRWLLDLAQQFDLLVMVGLPWEQHVCFLDDAELERRIIENCRQAVLQLENHPALLAYSIGNEIPGPIVRWHGKSAIEKFLYQLYQVVKTHDPESLVTYVNFPTTEYLELPFVDFVSFNVYLENEASQRSYLKRLHNLADDRPLLLAEAGLDSLRNGDLKQGEVLDWQIRSSFEEGCCGICIFAWTDQWHRGGYDITDWQFGLTTAERRPKPALEVVCSALEAVPFKNDFTWPSICVVVCSFNGAATIRDTFEGLSCLNYPDFQVIVINDGSTDQTANIAAEYPFKLLSTENRGLSAARNLGWQSATAEIIAYIDDDAYPDPDWLRFLAIAYRDNELHAVGGPNLAPDGDGWKAECVACSPGGPVHVLLSDTLAEHIPGCNMSFRRGALSTIDGFDARFRTAGDDVDICWRVRQEVGDIGFNAAAMVWHHRRNSFKTYWRQQRGYGRAEALLAQKWPEKYNSAGHLSWRGRIYGYGTPVPLATGRQRLYQGIWGSAPFQSIYEPSAGFLQSLALMPEWYLWISLGMVLTVLGLFWTPLLWVALPVSIMLALTLAQAVNNARHSSRNRSFGYCSKRFLFIVILHLVQPLARLSGRIVNGLHPWRGHAFSFPNLPFGKVLTIWREQGQTAVDTLGSVSTVLADSGHFARCGNEFDCWDLELQPSIMSRVRCRLGLEEHGGGRQLLRFALEPGTRPIPGVITLVLLLLAISAAIGGAKLVAIILAGMALVSALLIASGCAHGLSAFRKAIARFDEES